MKYCDHHGGGTEEVIREFKSPFELGEYLREKLWRFYVDVNFDNLRAKIAIPGGDPSRGWKELWIVSIDGYGVAGWTDSWFEEKK
jgi:hypothetical protein